MKLVNRRANVIDNQTDLEALDTITDFPVFMGCVDHEISDDLTADMSWSISKSNGIVQLRFLVPLNILYGAHHDSGLIGEIWMQHHKQFSNFIKKQSPKSVLEIGGAHGILSKEYKKEKPIEWVILEPNPSPAEGVDSVFIRGFFDDTFSFDGEVDTIIHSHVFEHVYNPNEFISHISNFLKQGQQLIFSLPNMKEMLKRKYTNCINFEHTVLITEPYIEYLLSKNGFTQVDKKYFKDDHSIFYAYIKDINSKLIPLPEGLYDQNKKLFVEYIEYLKDLILALNQKISNVDENKKIYLFGAHVFAQYLIAYGLNISRISFVLDNDNNKHKKRLYGTELIVMSPKILAVEDNPVVILKVGIYDNEIRKDILNNINSDTIFLD
tara:strand:- start:336 stop:1478 length:1143 start_codon:yes stop_codon:yes gene_type:complete